jgi:hypothetical protein
MKKLIYQIEGYTSVYNPKTEEVEKKLSLATVTVECSTQAEFDEAYSNAKEMAVGEIIVEGSFDYPTAPHNILAGEYVTINGVMYKATENIPNGEPIIVGQNAYETTIEAQLAELAKGE